jgi:hypothetical protein
MYWSVLTYISYIIYLIRFADNVQADRIAIGIKRIHDDADSAHKWENQKHAGEVQPYCTVTGKTTHILNPFRLEFKVITKAWMLFYKASRI